MKYKILSSKKKREIIQEYYSGEMSYRELGEKYHINPGTLRCWVHYFSKRKKVVPLPPESKPVVEMARKKNEDQSPEITALKARIRELEMQNLALNTLIDVAERNGIEIRKKSGAKQ